ncbi:MFS transporter [Microvirga sp. GCM10011540]|uniref:MFS transporter n=1 Tax=Microvirga sp. GCM10011540 TaxID=3317338 RepID=UPI003611F214
MSAHSSGLRRLHWLAGGFLLTFSSAFGQTFFIAVFANDLKAEFDLSDGGFGAFYMVATLASAATLMSIGRVADRSHLRWVAVLTLGGLALVSAAMAATASAWMLIPVLFGLRLFGQGLLGHISMTAMARWFVAGRGRAISIAAMGFPASQAVIPIVAVALTGAYGWRTTWLLGAAALLGVAAPLTIYLFRREPGGFEAASEDQASPRAAPARRQWTRAEVLRDPIFYALMPGVLASPFVVTGIFFHQVSIVHAKGWDLAWFVGWYAAHALATIGATFATGWAVDRFGSSRILPGFLAPLIIGIGVLALFDSPYAAPVFMVLSGLSLGSANTVLGAMWAELYGTRHLGSIRAVASAGGVFASALAPGLMGVLLDYGVSVTSQLLMLAGYTLASACMLVVVAPRLRRER